MARKPQVEVEGGLYHGFSLCGGSLAVAQTSNMKFTTTLTSLPEIVLDLLVHPAFRRRVKSDRQPHRHLWRNARPAMEKI